MKNYRAERSLAIPSRNTVVTGFATVLLALAAPVMHSQTLDCATANAEAHYQPVKHIDFSSKHNVMIKNQDGTLTPMDVPYYKSTLIAPGTWQIESDGDYSYLLEGDNEALAIDTGYGAGNIRQYLQTLTRKPLRFVANTHNHFDHTANDSYFDCAYMSEETAKKATIPFHSFEGIAFPRDYPRVIVSDGYKIQLGNREVEVFLIPNHTTGGTAYLDKREHILFSGDEIWRGGVNINANASVQQFDRNMAKLLLHRSEFTTLATGGFGVIDAAWVDRYHDITQAILAGKEGEVPGKRGAGGPGGPPQQGPVDPSAPLTYTRRFPRPGDAAEPGGGPGHDQSNEFTRRFSLNGASITYDTRHIES